MQRPPVATRVLAGLSVVAVALLVGLYVAVMRNQGDTPPTGWLIAMSAPGGLALVAAVSTARVAGVLLGVATLVLGALGVLAILTIGVGFLVVAAMTAAGSFIALSSNSQA